MQATISKRTDPMPNNSEVAVVEVFIDSKGIGYEIIDLGDNLYQVIRSTSKRTQTPKVVIGFDEMAAKYPNLKTFIQDIEAAFTQEETTEEDQKLADYAQQVTWFIRSRNIDIKATPMAEIMSSYNAWFEAMAERALKKEDLLKKTVLDFVKTNY